jgi:predicted dehydrogenase/nucleoside-diphosphate-sugar epimerase
MQAIVPGAAGFDSPEALLESIRVDVVHICTPPATHAPLALRALQAGSHVYVEKPFTERLEEARAILELASARGLLVCAGHQLLFEPPTRLLERFLPAIGRVAHIESYFSFRTVRHAPGGRRVLRADHQLLDILPHPVYLLLRVLQRDSEAEVHLQSLEVSPRGTVHALVRGGETTGTLVVTLEGRPVESFLRVVGTNGSLLADYVRGTVQRAIGPGSSGIDKLLAPYRQGRQVLVGSTVAFGRRFLSRGASYPGLAELFRAFYDSIRAGSASPVSPSSLLETVRICGQVAEALARAEAEALAASAPRPLIGTGVLVTGGTGFLGREVVKSLLAGGRSVRVLARRAPPAWERVVGAEYVEADLASGAASSWFAGVDTVVHAAAETAGGWDEHQRNSIDATETMVRGAARAGVRRFVHISSLAVLEGGGGPISDGHPLKADSRGSGPYVWGKLESERLAVRLGGELGLEVKVVRPGALVDYANFDPPGRLGKRLGNFFVAVGAPSDCLGVVDVAQAGETLAWIVGHWTSAPSVLNLIDPALPTKRDLLGRLRADNPDLSVLWLPTVILVPLSWAAMLAQRLLRPGSPPINVAKVFAVQSYDTRGADALVRALASGEPQRARESHGDLGRAHA